jgi:putative transposase
VTRQAQVLKLSRGSVYYQPCQVSEADLEIMRWIDELHLDYPFAGSRMLRDLLRGEGVAIGRRHVITLMKRMGVEAIYRRPNTSKPLPVDKIHPYLLRGLTVDRPDQVWAMDISYIPMRRGFVYLAAVIDWHTRRVLAWRVSITMEVEFCRGAVRDAMARHGKPEIFNTDQSLPSRRRGAASSPARPSPASWPTTASASAWTATVSCAWRLCPTLSPRRRALGRGRGQAPSEGAGYTSPRGG